IVLATVSAVCAGAVEDGLLAANPAAGFRKKLRPDSKRDRAEKIQALTQQQLDWLLITARERGSSIADLLLVMARTGMRVGEAIALQDGDVDHQAGVIRVQRSLDNRGRLEAHKTGVGGDVAAARAVLEALRARAVEKRRAKLAAGWTELPPWCFVTENGTPYRQRNVLRAFKALLKRAKLPSHH